MSKSIVELNDQFRQRDKSLGRYVMTLSVRELSIEKQYHLTELVRSFDSFDESNDAYGERNFGQVMMDDESYYWRIDYYDLALKFGAAGSSAPKVTRRVLTIMHSSEY